MCRTVWKYRRLFRTDAFVIRRDDREAARLQIKEFEIFKRTGNTEADRLVASKSAALIDNVVSKFVADEAYANMTNHQKRLILKKLLGEVNTAARDQAMKESPELFLEDVVKKSLSKDELRALEEAGIKLPEQKAKGGPVYSMDEQLLLKRYANR